MAARLAHHTGYCHRYYLCVYASCHANEEELCAEVRGFVLEENGESQLLQGYGGMGVAFVVLIKKIFL